MRFCGMSPDGVLPEIIEYADHPWFMGVQGQLTFGGIHAVWHARLQAIADCSQRRVARVVRPTPGGSYQAQALPGGRAEEPDRRCCWDDDLQDMRDDYD
jgi:hypothetical protein